MKNAKKLLALLLAFCMILSTNSVLGFAISGKHFSTVNEEDADMSVNITSVIYRYDGTDWVPTTVAKPGEEVKVRLFLTTSDVTDGFEFIVVWDDDVLDEYYPDSTVEGGYRDFGESDPLTMNSENDLGTNVMAADAYVCGHASGSKKLYLLSTMADTEDETYITTEQYEKYKDSFAILHATAGTSVVSEGATWVCEMPFMVKSTFSGSTTIAAPAFGVLEDSISGYAINEDADIDMEGMYGVTLDGAEMFSYVPYLTTVDAQISTTNTVNFDANGGTLSATSATGTVGSNVSVPTATSAPAGKTTTGVKWSTSADTTYADAQELSEVTVGYETGDETVTYYAIYDTATAPTATYKVNYFKQNLDDDDYTAAGSDSTKSGDVGAVITAEMCAPASFDDGFEFSYIDNTAATIAADGSTVVNYYMNRTVKTVTFDANGGTFSEDATTTKSLKYGAAIDATGITEPTPADGTKTFAGWATTSTATAASETLGTMGTADVTIYAVWDDAEYTVYFKAGAHGSFGLGATNKKVASGQTITADGIATITPDNGYEFAGWSLTQGATEADESLGTMGTADVTLFAVYTALKVKYDTYGSYSDGVFSKNGSFTKATDTKLTKDEVDAKADAITGYTLAGWSTTSYTPGEGTPDVTFPIDVVGTNPTSTVIIYPVYTKNTYTVTFDANGGTFASDATTYKPVAYGETITADGISTPTAPTGKEFLGWAKTSAATAAEALGTMGDSAVTVYAVYGWIDYTITYYIDGVQYGEVETYHFGDSISLRSTPVSARTFVGWTCVEQAVFPASMPAENLTVTGTYKYQVIFNVIEDGETAYSVGDYTAFEYDYNEVTTLDEVLDGSIDVDDFARYGYTLKGWSLTEGGEALEDNAAITFNKADINLYAVYSGPAVATVVVCDYNGDSIDDLMYDNALFTTLAAPTIEPAGPANYHLIGWAFLNDDGDPSYGTDAYDYSEELIDFSTTTVNAAITDEEYTIILIAVYAPDPFTLSYQVDYADGNGYVAYGTEETVAFGTPITLKDAPAYIDSAKADGYTWQGWEATAPTTMPAADTVIKGSFTPNNYTATFYAGTLGSFVGEGATSKTVAYGSSITTDGIATLTANPGYTFLGWSRTEGATAQDATLGVMDSTSGVTFYAVYAAESDVGYTVNVYTMDVDGNYGAPETTTPKAAQGATVTATYTMPTPNDAFYLDEAHDEYKVSGTVDAASPLVLNVYIARQSYSFKVTYVNGPAEATNISGTYFYGKTYSITSPAKAGYTPDKATVSGTVTGEVNETVTYTADAQPYKVTYVNAPAAAGVANIDTTKATDEAYTIAAPAVDGYTVTVDVNGTATETLTGTVPVDGITATVTYTANAQPYKVTYFNAPAAAGVANIDTTKATDEAYTIAAPAVDGYTAEVRVNNVVTTTLTGTVPVGGITATVTYTANAQPYKVTYVNAPAAAGVANIDTTKATGTSYTIAAPAVDGYTVTVNVNGTVTETLTGTVSVGGITATVTYTADAQPYKVTYVNAPAAADVKDIDTTKATGEAYTIAAPEVDGYTVAVKVNNTTTATLTGTVPAGGIDATVTYTANTYTLTINYKYEGGTTASKTYTTKVAYDSTYSVNSPAITGYTPDQATVAGTMNSTSGVTVDVIYTANQYDLTIVYQYADSTTASATHTEKVAYGKGYSVASPEIEGYTPDQATVKGTMNNTSGITVTVTYTANEYTLTIAYKYADGSEAAATKTQQVAYDSAYSVASPEIEGYTPDQATVKGTMNNTSGITVTVTYTANEYTLTIAYKYTDGSEAAATKTQQVAYDSAYSVDSPVINGYTPDKATVKGTMNSTSGITVTVTYTSNAATLTVNYYENGTTTPVKETKTVSTTVGAAYNESAPEVAGFTCSDAAKTGTVAAEGTTLTFYYTRKTITVNFNANEGTFAEGAVTEVTALYGAALTVPAVTREGYDFAGWTPALTGTEGAYTMPAANTTYTAQWTNGTSTKYTVEIYQMNILGEYELATTITGTDGETGLEKTLTVTGAPEGYVLDTESSVLTATIRPDGSTTFIIKYARPFTVVFDGIAYRYPAGASLVAPEPVVPEGVKFLGWSATYGATTADTLPATVTSDLTYYSVVVADTATISYYVNYLDGNGYVLAKTETGNIGAAVTGYTPVLEGYTFTGWSKTVTAFAEDVALYGSFAKAGYSVKYVRNVPDNAANGTVIQEYSDVAFGSAIPVPVTPGDVEYYTFTGYSYAKLGTATMPAQDLVIYANYERVPVKLIGRTDSVVIDRTNRDSEGYGIVYGLQTTSGAAIDEAALRNIFLDVEGDGTIEITPADTFMGFGLYGTGTKVTVIDNVTGLPVEGETFYIVVFGDVDGDGIITADDTSVIKNFTSYRDEPENLAVALAADVNHDGRINSNDTSIVKADVAAVEEIEQTATLTAASFNAYDPS